MISEQLKIDLAQITSQLRQLQEQTRDNDARTAAVERRARTAAVAVEELDRRSGQVLARLESKIKAQAKLFIRGGIAAGLGSALDSISLGDDPFSVAGSNIISSTLTAGAFGGIPAATVTFITSSIIELKRANEENARKLKETQAKFRAELDSLREDTYSLGRTATDRLEELEKELKEEVEKLERDTEELDYQTSQYVE